MRELIHKYEIKLEAAIQLKEHYEADGDTDGWLAASVMVRLFTEVLENLYELHDEYNGTTTTNH